MLSLDDILKTINSDKLKTIYYLLMLLSLTAFLYRKHQLKGQLSLIIPLLICSISIEAVVDYFKEPAGERYWFLFHIYQPIEYLLLALLFYNNIKSAWIRKYILASLLVYFVILSIYYGYHPFNINMPIYIDFVVEGFFLSIWSTVCIAELIDAEKITEPITLLPLFWIALAVLLFYSSGSFIMGFRYYFEETRSPFGRTWIDVSHYLNLLFYILLTIAFLLTPIMRKPLYNTMN